MTDGLRAKIAEVLETHNAYSIYEPDSELTKVTCDCGWVGDTDCCSEQYIHVADRILAIPGIAVVELPGYMTDRSNVHESIRHQPMWEKGQAWATIQEGGPDEGLVYFEIGSSGYGTVDAVEARDLAAALLAAADRADRGQ